MAQASNYYYICIFKSDVLVFDVTFKSSTSQFITTHVFIESHAAKYREAVVVIVCKVTDVVFIYSST